MHVAPASLVAFLIAISFAAGLNVYATVTVLGVLSRLHWCVLPAGLGELDHTWVIATAGILFCVELFADKIPVADTVWNALQTVVRLPVAALIAYRASAHLSPGLQIAVTVAGALIAALAHGSKTAARVLVSPSPEPVSNIALSSAEDVAAIGLTWVATRHPYVAGGVATALLVGLVLLLRVLVRALRRQAGRVREHVRKRWSTSAPR